MTFFQAKDETMEKENLMISCPLKEGSTRLAYRKFDLETLKKRFVAYRAKALGESEDYEPTQDELNLLKLYYDSDSEPYVVQVLNAETNAWEDKQSYQELPKDYLSVMTSDAWEISEIEKD